MANSCGEIRFLEGGTIVDSTIATSNITQSSVSNSTVDTSSITNLTSVDDASALKIVQAIAALPPSELQILVNVIQELLAATVPASDVDTTCTNGVIPGAVYGGTDALLGKPVQFAAFGNGVVPVYYTAGD